MKAKNEKTITIYMHKNEYDILENNVKKMKISKSSYIRELILNTNYLNDRNNFILYLENNKLLLENIYRIGSNINQIAHYLNMGINIKNKDIDERLQELETLLKDYKNFFINDMKKIKLTTKRTSK
ncbi:plasmid mobilization protein [Campylobacter troglodytis]|uniref:plasmid mobilization protein n=1 Tax=Campylobacter troglodytis TaxID=654363 RepID=UPI00115C2FFA|nr:plasmid mobilization relaxosome protein MobC [Campylobacter troglodytis]TQR56270.1 hypothetical protein DMC01_09310 [Campylobacter troglodytis]